MNHEHNWAAIWAITSEISTIAQLGAEKAVQIGTKIASVAFKVGKVLLKVGGFALQEAVFAVAGL